MASGASGQRRNRHCDGEAQAIHNTEDFRQVGIDPLAHKLVVVKLGYLFPDLARIAPRALMALSPGASDLDIPRLTFKHVRRPLFPLDPGMSWQAGSLGPTKRHMMTCTYLQDNPTQVNQ
jgi:hypothetical protein